jgi:putative component of membrane protein insertase Oxa1/YidC/SpoIIIJ protein YidD
MKLGTPINGNSLLRSGVKKTVLCCCLLLLSFCCIYKAHGQIQSNNAHFTAKESSTQDYIKFYQKYISGIRGGECPMYPSCSAYGMKVFSETGFAAGFVLTAERLMRCGHEQHYYALTLQPNGYKRIDYPPYATPPKELYFKHNTYYFAYADTVKDEAALLFIKKLINNGYYHEALLEIMRTEMSSSFNVELFINKIICLKAVDEYEKALFEFETKCPAEYKTNAELLYQMGLIAYHLENYNSALQYDSVAVQFSNDNYTTARLIALKSLAYVQKHEWKKAQESYATLSFYETFANAARQNQLLAEKGMQLKEKSPALAGVLSIVPGVGYAYTRHPQTAVSSFILNAALAFATYSGFHNDNIGLGVLTGIFSAAFYIANIEGSAKSAKRYNAQQKIKIIQQIENNTNL